MRNKLLKRIAVCAMAAIIGISNPAGILTGGTQSITAEAASKPKLHLTYNKVHTFRTTNTGFTKELNREGNIYISRYDKNKTNYVVARELPKNSKIKNVKSSNKKVIEVKKYWVDDYGHIVYNIKKAGTATISFDLVVNKKTYRYSVKIKTVKYENPFKSFKIGSQNYISKFNKTDWVGTDKGWQSFLKPVSGKLKISLKKNWKITEMYRMPMFNYDKKTTVKNNKKVNLKSEVLDICLKNTKTKQTLWMRMFFA